MSPRSLPFCSGRWVVQTQDRPQHQQLRALGAVGLVLISMFDTSFPCLVPHILVWGSCLWFCTPASGPPPPPPASSAYNLLTHNFSTHNLSTHNLLTHNLSTHNFSTHNFSTHNFSTHYFSTHNFSTHNLLTHNLSHTTCQHTTWHPPSLCVAGVALMALGWLWWRAWFPNDAVDAAAFCVAGLALGDMDVHPAWQAWDLVTSTVTLRGTDGTGLALVACLVPRWRRGRCGSLRGRRGTWRHRRASCVAVVGLGDIDRHFAWQAWRWWHWAGSGGALGSQMPRWRRGRHGSLRGRRGTWRHRRASCVAGVGLGDIYLRFRWQAWHFWHFWHWAGLSGTLVHTHLVYTQLVTTCPHNLSTYICCTCQSFTISFLVPAFPTPSLPFFCQLLEEVDMWGYPVL